MEKFALTEFGITAKDIRRKNIVYPNGQFDELNIYIEGDREGKKIYLIGECKAQLGKNVLTAAGAPVRVSGHPLLEW
jgi:hypothetical protein